MNNILVKLVCSGSEIMEASSQFHDDHAGVRLHMSRSWYKEPLVANQELLLLVKPPTTASSQGPDRPKFPCLKDNNLHEP
jgi:hypothetical protein